MFLRTRSAGYYVYVCRIFYGTCLVFRWAWPPWFACYVVRVAPWFACYVVLTARRGGLMTLGVDAGTPLTESCPGAASSRSWPPVPMTSPLARPSWSSRPRSNPTTRPPTFKPCPGPRRRSSRPPAPSSRRPSPALRLSRMQVSRFEMSSCVDMLMYMCIYICVCCV